MRWVASTTNCVSCSSGRILISDDGLTWTEALDPGIRMISADCARGIALLGGDGGTVYRSVDDGDSWELISTGASSVIWNLAFTPNGAIAGDASGVLLRSDDDGSSWSATGDCGFVVDGMWAAGQRAAVGCNRTVLMSDDEGATWSTGGYGPGWDQIDRIAFTGDTMVVSNIGFGSGQVYWSGDFGVTWEATQVPNFGYAADAWARDGELVVVGDAGQILHSLDDDASWYRATRYSPAGVNARQTPFHFSLTRIREVGEDTLVAVGSEGMLFRLGPSP